MRVSNFGDVREAEVLILAPYTHGLHGKKTVSVFFPGQGGGTAHLDTEEGKIHWIGVSGEEGAGLHSLLQYLQFPVTPLRARLEGRIVPCTCGGTVVLCDLIDLSLCH